MSRFRSHAARQREKCLFVCCCVDSLLSGQPAHETCTLGQRHLTLIWFCVSMSTVHKQLRPATQVDIVIVSCSCFAPTPSMAAMLVNRFKMRRDVLTYNLSGMGCSSSLICVDMAKHLLKVRPAARCLCASACLIAPCRAWAARCARRHGHGRSHGHGQAPAEGARQPD